jgi:hypothetical protein
MNATLTHKDETTNYSFNINHEGTNYSVLVFLDSRGKFIDERITKDEEELDYEGDEGQIREDIMDYLDKNWETLV